jgi:hypothetical protein
MAHSPGTVAPKARAGPTPKTPRLAGRRLNAKRASIALSRHFSMITIPISSSNPIFFAHRMTLLELASSARIRLCLRSAHIREGWTKLLPRSHTHGTQFDRQRRRNYLEIIDHLGVKRVVRISTGRRLG